MTKVLLKNKAARLPREMRRGILSDRIGSRELRRGELAPFPVEHGTIYFVIQDHVCHLLAVAVNISNGACIVQRNVFFQVHLVPSEIEVGEEGIYQPNLLVIG